MYIKAGALGGVAVAALLAMPAASLLTTRRSTMSFATLPVPASRKTRSLGGSREPLVRRCPSPAFSSAAASFDAPIPNNRGGADAAALQSPGGKRGTSSVSTATFNLIKNIMGAGVLSLPSGVAAFSGNPYALIPAALLTVAMGKLSGYCFQLIARSCDLNNVETYVESWEKAVSPKSAWIIPAACTFKTFCACLAYSIIIGDSFSSLLGSLGAPALVAARNNVIVWVTSLVLLPLCMLKRLDALAPFSLLGIVGVLFTAGVLALRLVDGTYSPGGVFYEAIAASSRPLLQSSDKLVGPMIFVLVSMLSTSFIAHYNAPKFYSDLETRDQPTLAKVTDRSFSFCTFMFIIMTAFGYLTFGKNSQGLILNNYAEQDQLAKLCRLAIGSSIMLGYPLTFIGIRDGILSLLGNRKPSGKAQTVTTVILLTLLSLLAMVLRDLGFVVSFGGALLGSCIIYIFPTIIFTRTIARKVASGELQDSAAWRREVALNKGIMGLGFLFAIIGGSVSVFKTFFLKH